MNGRCETDPFDQAINVCGLCFGEFCQTCLVMVKGRKHPLCKECAIVSAGLRAGAKPVIRGSRKTAKARRITLAEAPRQESFQFFEPTPLAVNTPDAEAGEVAAKAPANTNGDGKAKTKAKQKVKAKVKAKTDEKGSKPSGGKKSKRKARSKADALAEVDETIDIDSRLNGTGKPTAAEDAETLTFDPDDGSTADGSATGNHSAVDQLDQIRSTADTSETVEDDAKSAAPASFRRPRPFIKPADKVAPEAETTATPEPPQPVAPVAASATTEASTGEGDHLPKRRSKGTTAPAASKAPAAAGIDDHEARTSGSNGDKTAAPGELPKLPRRRQINRNHVRSDKRADEDQATAVATAVEPAVTETEQREGDSAETPSGLSDPFQPPAWTQQELPKRRETDSPAEDTPERAKDTAERAKDTAQPADATAQRAADTVQPAEDTVQPAEDTEERAEAAVPAGATKALPKRRGAGRKN